MTHKQKLAIAAIIAVAALLSGWTLMKGNGSAPAAAAHQEEGGHEKEARDDHGNHDDGDKKKDEHAEGESAHHDDEGRITLSQEQINAAGIVLQEAGPVRMDTGLQLPGEIRFNEDRTAHVIPQVAGIVESVSAKLGQKVRKGQVLAVISSSAVSEQRAELLNAEQRLALARSTWQREKQLWEQKISAEQDYQQSQVALQEAEVAARNARQKLRAIGATATAGNGGSLNRYEIRAPFDGTVVEKHLSLGEAVREDANAFLIADLSTVWAEIIVSPKDLQTLRVGTRAVVRATAFEASATGKVSFIGALIGEQTRTARAHVVLPNPEERWRPGLFVSVDVMNDTRDVPVAVQADAVQTVEDKPVVFVRVDDGFKAQPVRVGQSDGKSVEILSGLQPGQPYASTGSFAIKAELGKGSAEHSH